MTTVHLLRHGEVFNPDRVLYGRLPDFHLSDRGRAQAVAPPTGWSSASATGWSTCGARRSTARARRSRRSQERTGIDVQVDDRLIEADNKLEGQVVGTPRELVRVAVRPRNLALFVNPARPSWGEPYRQIAERVYAAVLSARAAAAEHGRRRRLRLAPAARSTPPGCSCPAARCAHSPRTRQCALTSVTSLTFAGPAASPVVTHIGYEAPEDGDAPDQVPGA